jgi:hypothetical protein
MAKVERMEIWQLRDAYFHWWLYTGEEDTNHTLWNFYQLCVGLRARRCIKRGGRQWPTVSHRSICRSSSAGLCTTPQRPSRT